MPYVIVMQAIRELAQKFRGLLLELFGAFGAFLVGGGGFFGTLQEGDRPSPGPPCADV